MYMPKVIGFFLQPQIFPNTRIHLSLQWVPFADNGCKLWISPISRPGSAPKANNRKIVPCVWPVPLTFSRYLFCCCQVHQPCITCNKNICLVDEGNCIEQVFWLSVWYDHLNSPAKRFCELLIEACMSLRACVSWQDTYDDARIILKCLPYSPCQQFCWRSCYR